MAGLFLTMNSQEKIYFHILNFLRALFLCTLVWILNKLLPLGVNLPLLYIGIYISTYLASSLSFTKVRLSTLFLGAFIFYVLYKLIIIFINFFSFEKNAQILATTILTEQLNLILIFSFIGLISAFLFWRYPIVVILETVLLTVGLVSAFSPHRNYRFDQFPLLTDWAWNFDVSHLQLLVILGALSFVLITAYILLATLPGKPIPAIMNNERQLLMQKTKPLWLLTFFGIFSLILFLISNATYNAHSSSVLSNGVRQESGEGMSPLDFHSSLGSSSQPAALVRLEGDYANNPNSPMLYFREAALSKYDGKKFVIASKNQDSDVSFASPGEFFENKNIPLVLHREPINQSIYLLSKHKLAFSLDYPISLVRLKIPKDNKKFKTAYRAYSMVPTYPKSVLDSANLRNPNWSESELKNYLETSKDERYLNLAEEITKTETSEIDKVFKMIEYLNKNAIYTLTPNHEVEKDGDPTATFLFGDKRGYCVHFAHATTYMLRSLGIPARIGTGYLTDLSQARDGHILLRMNDRHAWAEIFVNDIGWIPVDTQPEQVENHGETPVDMNLLEELMGFLEPGEEILPEDTLEDENINSQLEKSALDINPKSLLWILALTALSFMLTKLFLRFSWILPSNLETKLKRAYRAIGSYLEDLSIPREVAETRYEYMKRVSEELDMEILKLTPILNKTNYSNNKKISEDIISITKSDFKKLKNMGILNRFISLLNPTSVISFLRGEI